MDRVTVLDRLRALESELRSCGLEALYLFGSHARGEAKPTSDVDLFFDDDPQRPLSVYRVIDVGRFLSEALGAPVDLIPRDSLHRLVHDDVVAGAIRVY